MSNSNSQTKTILGLDPGRDKCGVAVIDKQQEVAYHQIIDSDQAIAIIKQLSQRYSLELIVIGDGTTSKTWREQLESNLDLPVVTINEANSTLEARDRYWTMYSPTGLQRLIPRSLRVPDRPVDDIVAILLVERYLAQ